MTTSSSEPAFDGPEDTLTIIGRNFPELAKEIRAKIEPIEAEGFLNTNGALTDALQEACPEIDTRPVQVVAATAPRDSAPSETRRNILQSVVVGFISGVAATAIMTPWQISQQERSADRLLSSSAIHQILNLYEDRAALEKLAETLTAAGRPNEAAFVACRLAHGSSYAETQHNLALLEHFLDGNDHDPTVKAFIAYRHAVDHRYIGLSDQCDTLAKAISLDGIQNAKLLALLIDLRYSTTQLGRMLHHRQFSGIAELCEAQRRDVQNHLSFDPANPSRDDVIGIARAISCEAANHFSHHALMRIYAATSEAEALEAFEGLAEVLAHIREHAKQTDSGYAYGESWWPLSNVALIALYREWERLAEKCADLAIHGHGTEDPQHQRFLETHRQRQTSPAFVTFGLVQSINAQVKQGRGAEALNIWLPRDAAVNLRHHTLSRGMIAFMRVLGASPKPSDRAASFARPEGSDLLFACIRRCRRSTST